MEMLLARVADKPSDGCWEWASARRNGYGVMKWNGRDQAAHRLMFNAVHGYYPEEVRHRCDNPPCVRPDHLEGGGRQDNVDDRVNRGRSARLPGRANPNARYTDEQVQAVIARKGTATGDTVAAELGVNRNFVYRVWGGQS